MKSSSIIRKKYLLNNLQILSKYELQDKFESALQSIKPNEILSDLSFFKEISQYYDCSNPEKAFITYKFTLYCYLLINNQETKVFQKLFIKYSKLFIKTCHKYYTFVIIKIYMDNIFKDLNEKLPVNEFNKIINNLIEEYKNNPFDSILDLNIDIFTKNDSNISFFFILLDSFKFPFDKEQINAISKYIVNNSNAIIKKIIIDKSSKISYFKKLNNIIQSHMKEIPIIITNNNSKKKSSIFMGEFFKSIIIIYNEIIKLFEMGLYDFYENDFIIEYIQKNLIVTIMQFLEKKNFCLDEKIIVKINELSDNIETFLINNLKINEKKYFIEYSWIMAQFFNFLYHSEDKTQSITYGNKIINLYKDKPFISRAIIFVKLTLYEYYIKKQKENYSEYDTNEHLNNISELLTMFGKCDIEGEITAKYLIKMINHLFQLLLEHIIFIINNRPTQVKNIYSLLVEINPSMINCKDNSKNKNIIIKINMFNIFCSLTSILKPNNNDNYNYRNNIYNFIKNNNIKREDIPLFINIISVFTIYDKNYHLKIFELLNDLYKKEDNIFFLEIFFNIFYQLEKIRNYNTSLFFDLLNLLNEFLNTNKSENNNAFNFKETYFNIYIVYAYNSIKYAYNSIFKTNKEQNKNLDSNNNIDSNGLLLQISDSIKLLIKFNEIHNKIIEKLYIITENNSYNNKSIYYLGLNLMIDYFLELIAYSNDYSSKNLAFIYQQIYLISTNENLFSSLPKYLQNFIYYILYRLIHNINNIISYRDLFLIKGNSNISKTIKTIIYNNIVLIKEERNKNNKNDTFFNLEPLLSSSKIQINFANKVEEQSIYNSLINNLIFNAKENSSNQYSNFKINFVLDTNNLFEIIKMHYLSGSSIDDATFMNNYFNYYIPILNKEKSFNNNFTLILNIFYIIKRIFLIPKTENQNEKIDFNFLCEIIKNNEKGLTGKKNILVRLLTKYIHITKGKIDNKKKINELLICLLNELKELKNEQTIPNNGQKSQRYLTYIELLSLEYFINIYNRDITDDNIDDLLYKGKLLLIKCLELCNAFLNEKYIMQYLSNEKLRLKAINDFFSEEIDAIDLIYLLNMDDYDFIFLQLLDKIYILTEFLFKKMFAYGYGDSIIELIHKFKNFTLLKYNKEFYITFLIYLIKIIRKWKRKEKYDIIIDIYDFKNDNDYNIFLSKLYYNYIIEKYPKYLSKNINYKNFKIIEFLNNNKLIDDPLLNKCLELNNINENFNNKEKSIYFKNKIKSLHNSICNKEKLNELKIQFLKEFNISSVPNYYFSNILIINYKYIIKIIPRLFENEIIKNIIMNDEIIDKIINLFKSAYQSYKTDNWQEYKYIKYCKKNLRNLIYISSSSQIIEVTIKLINLYICYFHNFKYNLAYKGSEIINDSNDSKDYIERINNMDDNSYKAMDLEINNDNINNIENKFNSFNLISIFKIRDYLYIYIKLKDKSSYDKIDIKKENEFESFFTNIKNIAVKENSKEKFKRKIKNEEYRKSLFSLQNLLIKFCPNFINSIKLYLKSHIKFNNYIKKKINKYSLKISTDELIDCLFESNNENIKSKTKSYYYENNKRFKLMSIIGYKNRFINKIFNSNKFKFSFYENNINDLFYYIPSIELSKLPLENIPLLYNLAIIRTLNINYIKLSSIIKEISITKDIFCLLNPKSDLVDTEKKILPIIKKNNILCINSKEPSEKEMNNIMNNKLMYIYCGHGDSLKYLKKEYIESHQINFLTFLFGCNSANSRLLSEKDTQPLSTPQLFLKKLCPFFFGFLWTVSSQDLDQLTVDLLEILFNSKNPVSLIKTITLLKRKFSLKWFNGGALVMYSNCDILPKFQK